MNRGEEACMYDFGGKGRTNETTRKTTTLKRILREIELSGMEWIDLAQDRDKWKPLVNTVINFQVP
jgi:hypothetical protein